MVNGGTWAQDGKQHCDVPSGWAIAPDEPDVRRICGKYTWGSDLLVLDDGSAVFTGFHAGGSAGEMCCCLWLRVRPLVLLHVHDHQQQGKGGQAAATSYVRGPQWLQKAANITTCC
jgi:hypothetical protein